jgi:hypothetical protein
MSSNVSLGGVMRKDSAAGDDEQLSCNLVQANAHTCLQKCINAKSLIHMRLRFDAGS